MRIASPRSCSRTNAVAGKERGDWGREEQRLEQSIAEKECLNAGVLAVRLFGDVVVRRGEGVASRGAAVCEAVGVFDGCLGGRRRN